MLSGRESGSAEAAGRLRLLALVLFLSVMPHGALSRELALPPLPPPAENTTCKNVPYPFGTRGKSLLPGFQVTCGPNNEAMLPIGNHRYRIDEVSVERGFVIILVGAIRQVCHDHSGKPMKSTGIGDISLQGTPFSFSSRNKLVATGCNYLLVASFANQPISAPKYTACFSWCNGNSSTTDCHHGVACCEALVPMNSSQEFTLVFDRIPGLTSGENGTCSAAFFLDQDEDVPMNSSDDGQRPLKGALLQAGDHRMILDWTIGRGTCDQAQNYNLAPPYCNDMSGCINAPSGAGHLCNCNSGYYGNPYAADGCLDINECRNYYSNTCSYQGDFCNNTKGGFTCSCPRNMTGDGHRTGTGCTEAPMPSGSPLQQPQGLNSCSHLETNPCEYTKYCTDVPGDVRCDCPRGMIGDGRKKGRGCRKPFPVDIVMGVGLALVVIVTTTTLCYYWSMKRREARRKRAELFRKNGGLLLQQRFSASTSQGKDSSAKIFSAQELKTATNNYSESQVLGRGGYGTVHKGVLPDETVVAVKRSRVFDESQDCQVEQFVNEITILSQTDHPNVVKLLGCCLETQVPLLVYEFIPNGTLFQHIHNRTAPHSLTWEATLRIAAETAEALAYLHSTSSIPIIHRDIKSSNILLDENFVAKISDFGASRSVPFDQTHVTTLIQGTIGYLDPEYFQSSMLTEKSDVYSFGVVLAELLTRQKPISVGRSEESCNLAMHIVILLTEGRLLQEIDPQILAEVGEEQLYAVAQLSVRCLNLSGQERPVMKEVASVLSELRRSFAMEQTMRRKDEPVQKNNELVLEARPISSLQCSEGSTQFSIEAEMIASSHSPR